MKIIQFPDAMYPAGNSLGWTFNLEVRGAEASHGYTAGCPQQATNVAKANGTVTITVRQASGDFVAGDIAEAGGTEIDALPVTALEDSGTSLEFTLYEPLDAATKYQMKALINLPDPDNTGEIIQFTVLENFTVTDKSV